jgi:hypothetical protein
MNQLDDDDYVGALRRAIDETTDSIQLYAWMRTRYAAFQALLAETRRPDWRRIAIGLAKVGVTDGNGNPPTAATARQTWWKVRQDVTARCKGPSPALEHTNNNSVDTQKQSSPTVPASPKPDVAPSANGFDPDDVDQETTEPEFRPAAPRTRPPTAEQQKPELRHAASKPDRGKHYDAALRQLTDRARARSLPMPQIPIAEDE